MRHTAGASSQDRLAGPAGVPAVRPAPEPAGDDSPYWTFHRCLARRQVAQWLPPEPVRLLDLTDGRPQLAEQLVDAGHVVVQVRASRADPEPAGPRRDPCRPRGRTAAGSGATADGSLHPVAADSCLTWLREGCVGAVVAESPGLPLAMGTAARLADVRRVLAPGGRLLLVVESLVLGLSRLAGQEDWEALAEVPRGGPLLLADADGRVTRYFRSAELRGLLVAAGFEVDAILPRTVLTPSAVERAVEQGVLLETLLQTEHQLAEQQDPDTAGLHLVACASRPEPA